MATFKATVYKGIANDDGAVIIEWTGLAASGDVGDPQQFAQWSDKTFIVTGSFTGTATCIIEASNDPGTPTNWVQLTNRQGTPMSFTAVGINTSQDRPVWIRPRLTAGLGGAAVDIRCCAHRTDLPGKGY